MKKFLSLAAAAIFAASTAQAALVVDFSGTPGSDETRLTFSGVAIANESGFFDVLRVGEDSIWNDVGALFDFSGIFETGLDDLIGEATLTIDGADRSIITFLTNPVSEDGGSFGIGVDGEDDFSFLAGSEVSWSGSMTAIGLDITDLNFGDPLTSFFTSKFGDTDNVLDLELTIAADDIAAVPLPAGGALLLSGLAAAVGLRRRKKATA